MITNKKIIKHYNRESKQENFSITAARITDVKIFIIQINKRRAKKINPLVDFLGIKRINFFYFIHEESFVAKCIKCPLYCSKIQTTANIFGDN